MRDHKINLLQNAEGKNSKKKNPAKGKGFGYQVLGFGAGGGKAIYAVDWLIVAGGGAGGGNKGAGGGAGGYRTSFQDSCVASICVEAGCVSVTVGAGGPNPGTACGQNGGDSSLPAFCLTSAGGGGGAAHCNVDGKTGGSGGGGSPVCGCGAAGNVPPTTPPQGNPGANGTGL